jgi:hypothetical protein
LLDAGVVESECFEAAAHPAFALMLLMMLVVRDRSCRGLISVLTIGLRGIRERGGSGEGRRAIPSSTNGCLDEQQVVVVESPQVIEVEQGVRRAQVDLEQGIRSGANSRTAAIGSRSQPGLILSLMRR